MFFRIALVCWQLVYWRNGQLAIAAERAVVVSTAAGAAWLVCWRGRAEPAAAGKFLAASAAAGAAWLVCWRGRAEPAAAGKFLAASTMAGAAWLVCWRNSQKAAAAGRVSAISTAAGASLLARRRLFDAQWPKGHCRCGDAGRVLASRACGRGGLLYPLWRELQAVAACALLAGVALPAGALAAAAPAKLPLKEASKKCWNDIDFQKIERELLSSPVQSKILMDRSWAKKYNNPALALRPVYKLKLKSAAYPGLKAVWKPSRPLSSQASAVFAYRLSKALKLKLAPPTVLRSIEGKEGILQLFVEAIPSSSAEEWGRAWRPLTRRQKNAAFAFYWTLGYHDIQHRHILIGKRCKRLALIDNDSVLSMPLFIAFGQSMSREWPYVGYRVKGGGYPVLRFEDYSLFPLAKARPFFARGKEEIKEIFPDMTKSFLKILTLYLPRESASGKNKLRRLMSLRKTALIQTTGKKPLRPRFVRWKGFYWIQDLAWPGLFIFSDSPPETYSRSLIKALKGLTRKRLNSFFPEFVREERRLAGMAAYLAAGALKRRDMILIEADAMPQKTSRQPD